MKKELGPSASIPPPVQGKFGKKVAKKINVDTKLEIHSQIPSAKCNFHYFHMYLKVGYYLGTIPFKLKFNRESGHYHLSKVKLLQKVCRVHVSYR